MNIFNVLTSMLMKIQSFAM